MVVTLGITLICLFSWYTDSSVTPLVVKQANTSVTQNDGQDTSPQEIKSLTRVLDKAGIGRAEGRTGPSVALQSYMEYLRPTLKPEDAQTAFALIEQHPHLGDRFTVIAAFLVTFAQQSQNYMSLYDLLVIIQEPVRPTSDSVRVANFAVLVGFVERSAVLYEQIKRERNLAEITKVYSGKSDAALGCLYQLMSTYLNYTDNSPDFRVGLAKTSVLPSLIDNIKAMRDLSEECLVCKVARLTDISRA